MTLYRYESNAQTGVQGMVELTPEEITAIHLRRTYLTVDDDVITADGVDVATVTVISELDAVTVDVDGDMRVINPQVDPEIEITADAPGVIVVTVVDNNVQLEIVAEV